MNSFTSIDAFRMLHSRQEFLIRMQSRHLSDTSECNFAQKGYKKVVVMSTSETHAVCGSKTQYRDVAFGYRLPAFTPTRAPKTIGH